MFNYTDTENYNIFFVFVPSIIYTDAVSHLFNSATNIAVVITLFCAVTETCSFYIVGDFRFFHEYFPDVFS